jgi:hypothetical protein
MECEEHIKQWIIEVEEFSNLKAVSKELLHLDGALSIQL